MPKIKIAHVVSFSSEDPVHVANNVLNNDPAKKWKCKDSGERSATIVLQLEKATVISGIDIGNENSAYIEVLVSRSEAQDDYKVLLVMSSFMSPLEARQSSNINKVRMFAKDLLSKPECEQKWDRIKIVCTQPFNRHVQYGLSFVNFHTPGEKTNSTVVLATIGKFTLRPESPDNLSAGSLFARKRESLSAAAAIREASSSASPIAKPKIKINNSLSNNSSDSEGSKPLPRNRNEILYSKDEEEPNDKIDKLIEKEKERKNVEVKKIATPKANNSRKTELEAKNSTPRANRESTGKRKHESEPSTSPKKKVKVDKPRARKPFNELFKGVSFVISGIQNPDRGNLRTMAQSMGAKYKPDWDNSCSHLICAFANTPKFNQVKGKGKIVTRKWIEECHSQRKRLPWRRFCLDKNDSKKPESEDEIWEEIKEEEKTDNSSSDDEGYDDLKMQKRIDTILEKNNTDKKIQKDSSNSSSTDEEGYDDTKMQERIDEILAKQKESNSNSSNVFCLDTDSDDDIVSTTDLEISKKLPDFLNLKTFFIDDTLDEDITKILERYVIAYKGIVAENPSDDVDYIITSENNADHLKSNFSQAQCLRPDWLWDCHNNKSFVSTDGYEL